LINGNKNSVPESQTKDMIVLFHLVQKYGLKRIILQIRD
jgi:hypothetical protein